MIVTPRRFNCRHAVVTQILLYVFAFEEAWTFRRDVWDQDVLPKMETSFLFGQNQGKNPLTPPSTQIFLTNFVKVLSKNTID